MRKNRSRGMLSEELSDGINSWSCRGKLFLKTLNSSEAKLPLSLPLLRSLSLPQSSHIFMPVLDCLGYFFLLKRADNTNICYVSDIMKLKNVSSFVFLQYFTEICLECFSSAFLLSSS